MNKYDLLNSYLSIYQSASTWIDSIPSDIRDGFFDNTLVNGLHKQISLLLEYVYTEAELFDIDLYTEAFELSGRINGEPFYIRSKEEFLDFMQTNYEWEQ